nr:PREDICTED: CD27 antigen-like [Latimeria chalumnae]|eukprot:XP_014351928.1 PREDICTED: CD27 antigen-like [Latimeria chalumnae]
MKSRCTATSDTHCEPCVTGEAFNTGWNTKFSCERCRLCVEVFRYMKNCTHDSDSECTCKPGLTCLDSECTRCGISTPASMSSHRDPRTTDQKLETTDPNSPSNISPEKGTTFSTSRRRKKNCSPTGPPQRKRKARCPSKRKRKATVNKSISEASNQILGLGKN